MVFLLVYPGGLDNNNDAQAVNPLKTLKSLCHKPMKRISAPDCLGDSTFDLWRRFVADRQQAATTGPARSGH
jgi:hypothetical protein